MNEYRQRALNRVNNTSGNAGSTTSTYRQRALNRQQPKVEEPKVEIAEVKEQKYNFTPEDAINLKNTLNSRLQRINDKGLSEERIQEIKETSPILNPEKYHKDVDAGYYGRKAAEGLMRAGEGISDASTMAVEHMKYPFLKGAETVTSLGGLVKNPISNVYSNMIEKNKEKSLKAMQETPVDNYARMTDFIYNNASKGHKLAGEVVSAATGMLPTLAANILAPGAGYAMLAGQGYGSGTQQAYQHTGELGAKEEIYGLLSGLAEVAVEKLSGGIGGLGNGMVDDIASKLIKNGLIRSATGEGIEEAVTTIIDPYLQRLTYDKGAEGAKASEVLRSAIVGSLTSMLLQGGSAAINLPQTIQQNKQNRAELRNSLEGLDKMLPTYESQSESATSQENVARELPTMALQQAMLPTNRIEGETAQTGNMEQMAKNKEKVAQFSKKTDVAGEKPAFSMPKIKELQLKIIQENNSMNDDYHVGIRTVDDIKTFDEVIDDDESFVWGDFSREDAQEALEKGEITVYSSREIKNGNFVSTSYNQAKDYAGNGKVYSKTVPLEDVAWINGDEGQYAKVERANKGSFSMPKNYIDPSQDIQKATEFVSKATVEDIDTLNKMVEEAEKYPDRVDLQFFAEKVREAIEKLSRQQVRQAIMEETGVEEYNLDDANKISKAKMNFTTPVRVIEKIFNKETANKINDNFFKPIKHNEAERIRRLNKERADIKELDIKPGGAEDAAIQKYGEGEYVDTNGVTIPYTLENLKRDFPDTWQKLQNATNVIRNKYDTYLEEINEVLKDNGYDPIPKRKDYFRHFEELNDLFSILGVPTKVDDIPTDLNGMTADLKPGKQFFANALQRKGNKTTYSAIKGIDGYLDGAMNILYHTKDIQKLRTLDKYIRDTYGASKGLSEATTMTDEQKAKRINQINEGHLSEFAAWLTEYTNALAGKKSRLDRGIEEMFGRKSYKYLNLIKKQVGANMTGLNVNSALSNFISVIQAGPKTNKKALVKGTIDTVKNIFENDGFIDKSDFLTTRFGTDKLAKNWWQKAGDAGQIFMSGTDYFTANLITRSKYQEFLDKGYTEAEAIKKADEFADRLMAGRGKGDLPTAFESKTLGIVTQFQLEVTNQLDSIFYDTLHEDYAAESNSKLAKEHPKFYNAASATFILGQIFALAFLYNEGKEELTGTEGGALDPIGTIADAMKYLTDENLSKPEAIANIVEDIANQLPFASIITGGGRLPIKEAFPDLLSVAKGEAKLGDEMWKLANLLLPTGGGQVKKTTQGLNTFAKGGSYSKDAEGKEKLKYPVEQNAINLVKSALFGKWSTPGARDYIDRGFKPLSANQTEAYNKAMKAGISSDDFFKVYDATRGIEGDKDRNGKTIENSKSKKLKEAIDKATPKLTSKQRQILYDAFNVSKTVQGGNSKLPTQSDFKVKLPQVKIEK